MVSAAAGGKRRVIIDAARTVFLDHGYAGASMDEVAALASTSKRTLYGHFGDKQGLFTAVLLSDIQDAERQAQGVVQALAASEDVEADLRAYARRHLAIVTQPHMVRLRRLVIGEAERFPDLASTWYAAGPERERVTMAEVFAALGARGLLAVPDPALAAQHFNWLILSIPLNEAMFRPSDAPFRPAELDRHADEGTRVFLAAYGTR